MSRNIATAPAAQPTSLDRAVADGLPVLTPDGVPESEPACVSLARASRQADELAGLLERTRATYQAAIPAGVQQVLALVADQLGGMHVEFDELSEELAASAYDSSQPTPSTSLWRLAGA